jgi:GT2 family glycosyltransferase
LFFYTKKVLNTTGFNEPLTLSLIVITKKFPNPNLFELIKSTSFFTFKFEVIIVISNLCNQVQPCLTTMLNEISNVINLKVIMTDSDRGASFARNLGASVATSPNLLFSDDDTVIFEDVMPLLFFLKTDQFQGVQPLIMKYADPAVIDSAGDFVKRGKRGLLYVPYSRKQGELFSQIDCDFEELPSLRGSFMIVKKEVFDAVNGFDNLLDFGYEDVDLGWRMTFAGYNLLFAPNIKVLHKGGRSADYKKIDTEAEITHLVNYHLMQIKFLHHAIPYVLIHFNYKLINRELWKIQKGTANCKSALREFFLVSKMFLLKTLYLVLNGSFVYTCTDKAKEKFSAYLKGKKLLVKFV